MLVVLFGGAGDGGGSAYRRSSLGEDFAQESPRCQWPGDLSTSRSGIKETGEHQPTEPSICSWIKRFISTAYSIGSSFTNGSKKPLTIIVLASDSVIPRLVR